MGKKERERQIKRVEEKERQMALYQVQMFLAVKYKRLI
jgi:hypothetical protein